MSLTSFDRLQALRLLFTEPQAKLLANLSWGDIQIGLNTPLESSPFRRWTGHERERLAALLVLLADYQRNPPSSTSTLAIAAAFHRRVSKLQVRTIWIVGLSADLHIDEEVLAVMGGDLVASPPLKTLLRLVLIRPATTFLVIDFRPFSQAPVDPGTITAFDRLRDLANTAGVRVHDWIVLGFDNAASCKEHLIAHAAREPVVIDVAAA